MENYTQHITRTRIVIPRKRADLVSRQRLLDTLDELLDKKVIIIAAPAGYGKTSLLIDLADDLALPVCWYSLDALDQNISRFLEYFVASIQVKFPDFKTNIINVLHSSFQKEADVDALVTMLVNDIYDQITEHFVIMLDDYHLVVNDTQINQFLSRFLQNAEENCHIVFASRTLLALPDLPLMVARGLVGGLGFEELAFTTGETRELFFTNHHIVLSDSEAETLCKQTEGWITGLLLTAQTSITRLQAHEKSLRATGININDYFELIYNAQPEHIQQFLLYTSLLEDFDFDTVNQTVAKLFPALGKQYKACADHIFKANLFVQSVGLDGLSLRYHHLFLDYLQQKVRLEQVETYEKLQDIIATHYRGTQQWEKAYEIYRKEGQLEKQIALLEEAGVAMMFAGQASIIKSWIEEIPEDNIVTNPSICSLLGAVLILNNDITNSLLYLNIALSKIDTNEDFDLSARTMVRKALCLRAIGDYANSLSIANEALLITDNKPALRAIRAEIYRIIGTCNIEMGNLDDSIKYFHLALDDFKYLNKFDEIALTSLNISGAYLSLNQLKKAESYILDNIPHLEKNGNYEVLANGLNNLGVVQHTNGEIEKAIMNLEKALQYSRLTKYKRIEAVTLCSIGDIYLDLFAFDEAETLLQDGFSISEQINAKHLSVYALSSLALLAIFQKNNPISINHITKAEILANSLNSQFYNYLVKFVKAIYLYSENSLLESMDYFSEAHNYFKETHQVKYFGSTLIFQILLFEKLENMESFIDSCKLLNDYFQNSENRFPIIAIGIKEYNDLLNIAKKYPQIKILKQLVNAIQQYQDEIPVFRRRIRRKTTIIPFARPTLEIISLGDKKVIYNDLLLSSSDWQTQSARDFFFLVLSKPQGLTKEEIGVILWPEDSDQELKFHFKNAIYRVRHAIGKDSIVLDGDKYLFNRNIDFHFDAESFRREVHLSLESEEWSNKLQHFGNATKYYKGPYLPDMDADWINSEREALHSLYMHLLLEIGKSAFAQELFEQTINISMEILRHDSCQEEAYRLAMRAQSANGNRKEVDRLFKLCQKNLMDELEAPPSQRTKNLHKTLMRL